MKNRKALLILVAMSIVAGTGLSNIPWGNPAKFHGTGFPFPIVMWDVNPGTGRMSDYPNAAGILLNILLVFVAGGILLLISRAISRRLLTRGKK